MQAQLMFRSITSRVFNAVRGVHSALWIFILWTMGFWISVFIFKDLSHRIDQFWFGLGYLVYGWLFLMAMMWSLLDE
jgi:hypothetical protein